MYLHPVGMIKLAVGYISLTPDNIYHCYIPFSKCLKNMYVVLYKEIAVVCGCRGRSEFIIYSALQHW